MKKSSTIYYVGAAVLIYFIYNKYYKNAPSTPAVVKNFESFPGQVTPAQQVAAPAIENMGAQFNVKYSISGSKSFKGTPSTI